MNLDCNLCTVKVKPVTAIDVMQSAAAQNKQHVDTRSLTLFA